MLVELRCGCWRHLQQLGFLGVTSLPLAVDRRYIIARPPVRLHIMGRLSAVADMILNHYIITATSALGKRHEAQDSYTLNLV